MLYNLSWLESGKPFPPTAEKARIQRYKENAQLFDNEHFESSVLRHRDGFCSETTSIAVYDECARRISRVIGNFENIISFAMDLWGWSRKKSVIINLVVMTVLSVPCVLGFNVLSGVTPLGMDIMKFEDFVVSNNIIPLGALVYLFFLRVLVCNHVYFP